MSETTLRRASPFRGKNPKKVNRSVLKPDATSAARIAEAPGTGDTVTPASRAALTNRAPGSDSRGVPASDTSASDSPAVSRATSAGVVLASLCS